MSSAPDSTIEAATLLAANDFAYQRLRREVDRRRGRNDPELPPLIEAVAQFAAIAHPGRLADGALDNVLLEIGRSLADLPPPSDAEALALNFLAAPSGSRTLHVASEVFTTGGHSRILAKWVQRDLSSSHAVVITRQSAELPAYLVAIAAERGAPIIMLDRQEGRAERARRLRALSGAFDRVILHHHPDDCVPVLAFAKPGGAPVAMFNHAHFWFSLGGGVSDVIINTTPYFQRLTERHRFPRATDLLQGPPGLEPMRWSDLDKPRAKASLGLPPDAPVAITIGQQHYYTPFGGVDFFETLARLLAARADLQVLAVGIPEESALVPAHIRETGRVRLVGKVADPRPYYEAADICLESFPMPSLGALVEAVAVGQAFPVPAYAEAESPTRVNQHPIAAVSVRQPTEADYVRYVRELLDAREATSARAAELRRALIRDDEGFGDQFAAMYDRIARSPHQPREAPRTACAVTPDTLALASLTKLENVGAAFDLLPPWAAGPAHARAVARGYETPAVAADRFARQLARPVSHRLPDGVRRLFRRR